VAAGAHAGQLDAPRMKPMVLRYQVGPSEFLARDQLIAPHAYRDAYRAVWRETLKFMAACAVGLVAAFKADSALLMLVLGTALLARLTEPWGVKVGFKSALAALAEKMIRRRDVRLTIDDAGLHEEVEGIRSFAPWPAVKSYARVNDVLLVELAADLWALIPAVAFLGEGAASEGEVIAVLNARGVHEREPDRARSFSPEHV
jgi:hypothetical protein